MVTDSLRYWVEDCHVDGFRFDLATSLGRDRDAFDPHAVFLDAVHQDPALQKVKLIAEPWDTGPYGYQVGGFPPGWAEWNDRYPRHHPRLLEGRRGHRRRPCRQSARLGRSVREAGAAAVGERQLRHRA